MCQRCAKAGFPYIDTQSWFGLFATAGTSKPVVDQIQKDVVSVFAEPTFQAKIQALAFTPVVSAPDDFAKFIAEDLAYKKQAAYRDDEHQGGVALFVFTFVTATKANTGLKKDPVVWAA
jgi:hypothetical protein